MRHHAGWPWLLCVLAGPLFLYGLSSTYLWTDEAQTAQLGRSVLAQGLPHTGTGPDSVSAHCGEEAGLGGLHLQMPWGQAYLAALSLGLFGKTAWAARLPFALFGWGCVFAAAWLARRAGGDSTSQAFAALLVSTNVYFLLHARQARYYAPAAFLVLVAMGCYLGAREGSEGDRRRLTAALVALCLVLDVAALGLLAVLATYTAAEWKWGERSSDSRLRPAVFALPAGVLMAWLALASTAPSRHRVILDPGRLAIKALYYAVHVNAHVAPFIVLVPLALYWWRSQRADRKAVWSPLLLLAAAVVSGMVAALAPPRMYPRYMIAFVPLLLTLLGLWLGWLARCGNRFRAVAVLLLVVTVSGWAGKISNDLARIAGKRLRIDRYTRLHPTEPWRPPLLNLLDELRQPPHGPIAAVAEYLRRHGSPGEVIVTTYGVPPLRFHTDLEPYGGLTCQLPPPGVLPDWIWVRQGWKGGLSSRTVAWIEEHVPLSHYRRIVLPVPDRLFENREALHRHVFYNPGPPAPPVVLLQRIR